MWGVSRIGTGINNGANEWVPATLTACGPSTQVLPPNDVRVCNGRLVDAVNDDGGQTTVAMYPKQPFDIAGRTGKATFDVSDDSQGIHAAWPEFWWTDQPVPAPGNQRSGQAPYARNSLGVTFAQQCLSTAGGTTGGSTGFVGVDSMFQSTNYAMSSIGFTLDGCVTKGSSSALNHVELRISTATIEVWATDAGSSTLRKIAHAANHNPAMTRGVVWVQDVHYNADKFDTQRDHQFTWDNLGFDGPAPYRDLTFDVPDRTPSSLGYDDSGGNVVLTVPNVAWQQTPTAQYVLVNFYPFQKVAPTVRVNGGAWQTLAWPYPDSITYSWRTIAISVPASDIHAGTNTIEFQGGKQLVLSNVNLALIAATGVS